MVVPLVTAAGATWPRCAEWAREVDVDPIGSAPAAMAFVLVDWPLPWPSDVGGIEELTQLASVAADNSVRLQLAVPRPASAAGTVVLYRARVDEDGWFEGHRFAPTGVLFSSGTAWAYLEGATLRQITARQGRVGSVLDRYRGSLGFVVPRWQAAEREAFREVGWTWWEWRRRALDIADGTVRIEGIDPGGARHASEIAVEPGRTVAYRPVAGHANR